MDRLEELDGAIGAEKDLRVRNRMLAVRAVLKLRNSISDVAEIFDVTSRCIRLWTERFKSQGPDGLQDSPRSGRPPAVPLNRIKKMARRMYRKARLTPKDLQKKMRQTLGVRYCLNYTRKLLHRTGFSKRIPTPVHARASSSEECNRWHEDTMWMVLRMKRRGFAVLVQDESFFVNDVKKGYRLWAPVGTPIHVPYSGSHRKVAVYGAVSDDGSHLFRTHDTFDSQTFVRYLDELRHKYGRIFVIADGASPHRSNTVKDYLARYHDRVVIRRLPVASPHMNATEECWHQAKRAILVGMHHTSFEEMKKSIAVYFRTARFRLDLYVYLQRRLVNGNYL